MSCSTEHAASGSAVPLSPAPSASPEQVRRQRLARLQRDVAATIDSLNTLDGTLTRRAGPSMKNRAAVLQQRLVELVSEPADANRLDAWARLESVYWDVTNLKEEALTLLMAAAYRSVDREYYRIADLLVDTLVAPMAPLKWDSFVLPVASEEFLVSSTSIGVRYPPSIWHLPLLAHEVGHLVALELKNDAHKVPGFPVLELAGSGSALDWSHSLELFADAFGAYVLGPAYVLTCLLLEFDPLLADDAAQDQAHPSFNRRFAALAVGVGRLEHPGVRAVGRQVLDEWARLVGDVGGPVPPSDQGDDADLLAGIDSIIVTHLRGRAYPGWTEARRLATTMLAGVPTQKALSSTTTLPDVLNAAWYVRWLHWQKTDAAEAQVRHLSQLLIDGK